MKLPGRPRPALLAFPVALGLSALAYSRSLGCEFQLDDELTVVRNLSLKNLDQFLRVHLPWEILAGSRSVTDLTFAVNYRLSGLDVRAFHATNVLLHLVAVLLVFVFTRATLARAGSPRRERLAVFVAGAFALHPLMSQAVIYVTQRAEVLASIFYLSSLLLLMRTEEKGLSRKGVASYLLALVAFALGLGAKPIVVTLPAAYLLHGLVAPARPEGGSRFGPWPRRLGLTLPFFAGSALFAAAQLPGLRGSPHAGFDIPSLGPGRYLLTQLHVLLTYLRLALWPAGQNLDWTFPLSSGVFEPRTLLAGLGVIALVAGAAFLGRWGRTRDSGGALRLRGATRPYAQGEREGDEARAARLAAFGLLWFLLVLAPTSSFIPLADVLVEHRTYLASWGVILAVAAGGDVLVGRLLRDPGRARAARGALAAAIWIVLGVALHERNLVWRSEESIWRDVVAKSPGKARAHANLGNALVEEGALEPAVEEFRRALELIGDRSVALRDLVLNMSEALYELKRVDEAMGMLQEALSESSDDPPLLNILALCSIEKRQLVNAEALARQAIGLDPHFAAAHHTLGLVLLERRDVAAAASEFAAAVGIDPESEPSLLNLAYAHQRLGNRAAACAAWTTLSSRARTGDSLQLAARERRLIGCDRR